MSSSSSAKKKGRGHLGRKRRGLQSDAAVEILDLFQKPDSTVAKFQHFINNFEKFLNLKYTTDANGDVVEGEKDILVKCIAIGDANSVFYNSKRIKQRKTLLKSYDINHETTVGEILDKGDVAIGEAVKYFQESKQMKIDVVATECINMMLEWKEKHAEVDKKRNYLTRINKLERQLKTQDNLYKLCKRELKEAKDDEDDGRIEDAEDTKENVKMKREKLKESIAKRKANIVKTFNGMTYDELVEYVEKHNRRSPPRKKTATRKKSQSPKALNLVSSSSNSDDDDEDKNDDDDEEDDEDGKKSGSSSDEDSSSAYTPPRSSGKKRKSPKKTTSSSKKKRR